MPLLPIFPSKDKFAPTQPVFSNLSPSEELHVLMAGIAEPNQANSVGSSVTNSEVFGQDGNGENSDEFRLDEGAQQQQEHRRTPTIDAFAEQNIFKTLMERIDELEKNMAKANAEQLAQLAKMHNEIMEKIGKLEKKQEVLLNLQNFWDAGASHKDIEIVGNDRLTVRNKRNDWCCAIAKNPIVPNKFFADGTFYFEISIKQKKIYYVSLGFAFKPTKLDRSIRRSSGTYAWDSDGEILINGSGKGPNGKYSFRVGDVVGIGVNLANRQMFLTKNGLRLDSSDLFVDPSSAVDQLFPIVSLLGFCDEIEANFGPIFKFDLANL